MFKIKFISIRTKLIFILSISATIALVLSSVAVFYDTNNKVKSDNLISLSNMTSILAKNILAPIEFDDTLGAQQLLKTIEVDIDVDGAFIFKENKEIFASFIRDGVDKKHIDELFLSAYSDNDIKKNIEFVEHDHILISTPLHIDGEYIATLGLVANKKKLNETISDLLKVQALVSMAVLSIIFILSLKLNAIFTKPIFRLKDAMEDMVKNDNLDVQMQVKSNDEFGILFNGFNKMTAKIKEQQNKLTNYNNTLNETIELKTQDINRQKKELESTLATIDENIIFSKTDLSGRITYVSKAFIKVSGYSKDELIGAPHNIVRHPDMPKSAFEDMWKTIQAEKKWVGEVKNLKKDGGFYWVYAVVSPDYDVDGNFIGYSSTRSDITAQKEVEELSENLEKKVALRTAEFLEQKEFVTTLLDSQEQMIVTTDGKTLKSANETFMDFFAVDSVEDFKSEYNVTTVADIFSQKSPDNFLQTMMGNETWLDYVISRQFDHVHKAMITRGDTNFIFSVSGTKLPGNDEEKLAVFTDITEMEKAKKEIEEIHKSTKDSIEYASLIQGALIPNNNSFRKYFKDFFAIWHPKDLVGGDIYLFEELRNEEECLLMVIDCTGHGVPGAFVTMLVKAIERQIVSKIKHSDEEVSPSNLLSVFNKSMKHLLKQEDIESISNAGFDGGILYYNKKEKIIKYSGAETPLFYVEDGELNMIKGSRHSIGYKKSDVGYTFEEHVIDVKEGMQFYLTTDGYYDQNGGEKGFPFGKKRFKNIIKEYHEESFADQQEIFIDELSKYENGSIRNDDVTLIGLKI